MRPVFCAANVGFHSLTNNSAPRQRRFTAVDVMMPSLHPDVTGAVKSSVQVRRKWSTRHDNGTRNAFLVVFARRRLERKVSFRESKRFIVQGAMRKNSQQDVLNATRSLRLVE